MTCFFAHKFICQIDALESASRELRSHLGPGGPKDTTLSQDSAQTSRGEREGIPEQESLCSQQ